MRLGVVLRPDEGDLAARAALADEVGIDVLWLEESPEAFAAPLVAAAALAGRTSAVRIVASVQAGPHPLYLAEEAAVAAWKSVAGDPDRIIYRRRSDNVGYKAGNVRDFCARWGDQFNLMLPLDADSLMSGAEIVRAASTTPHAAAMPIAGAPRTVSAWIAAATSSLLRQATYSTANGNLRWSSSSSASPVQRIGRTWS